MAPILAQRVGKGNDYFGRFLAYFMIIGVL